MKKANQRPQIANDLEQGCKNHHTHTHVFFGWSPKTPSMAVFFVSILNSDLQKRVPSNALDVFMCFLDSVCFGSENDDLVFLGMPGSEIMVCRVSMQLNKRDINVNRGLW